MQILFAVCMLAASAFVGAGETPAPVPPAAETVKGEVLEVLDANGFTDMRLKTKDGEFWTSVTKVPVKVGSQVTVENVMAMKDRQV